MCCTSHSIDENLLLLVCWRDLERKVNVERRTAGYPIVDLRMVAPMKCILHVHKYVTMIACFSYLAILKLSGDEKGSCGELVFNCFHLYFKN